MISVRGFVYIFVSPVDTFSLPSSWLLLVDRSIAADTSHRLISGYGLTDDVLLRW